MRPGRHPGRTLANHPTAGRARAPAGAPEPGRARGRHHQPGGVGYRYAHEQRGEWAQAARYPTFEDVQARLATIAEHLPLSRSYISLFHGHPKWPMPADRRLIEFHHPVPAFWSWRPDWHKPQPGMLLQALEDLNVAPSEALMVGDRLEDQKAAHAAGVPFRWATADWMLW
ncbi:MAG TPA: HAD hydrolase-like protein [Candidatus Competibacteraceae bacterium]|nr:HAD hydrolase-like protein [Candidatus Competibacteraceae bacterium]